jgi:Flp pilus assembly protein TadG
MKLGMIDMRRGSRSAASPGVRVETRSSDKQARGRARYERGQAAVEFALVLPLMLTVFVAVLLFGIAFDNDEALTFATSSSAQLLSISRGQTTDPCQTVSQAVYSAAPQLKQSSIFFTIVLNGNTVVANKAQPTCASATTDMVSSTNAQVTATYPCNINIFGLHPAPSCTLAAQTTVLVQ